METQIRNGDVFLRLLDGLPDDAVQVTMDNPQVLAYGEVTGHAHQITGTVAERFEKGSRQFVSLFGTGTLTHEEHGEAALQPGVYEVLIERDYDPTIHARKVVD